MGACLWVLEGWGLTSTCRNSGGTSRRTRCLPDACPLLGAAPAAPHHSRVPSVASGQSAPCWLQGQVGICDLPHSCPPWQPQAPGARGYHIGETQEPRCRRPQVQQELAECCRGACWKGVRQA